MEVSSLELVPLLGPARDYITHKEQVSLGLTDRSIYHGPPTDEVDAAWEALYEGMCSSATQPLFIAYLSNLQGFRWNICYPCIPSGPPCQ